MNINKTNKEMELESDENIKFDFMSALQAELEGDNDVEEQEEKCLISNEVLTDDNKVTLPCGHKFIFDALYKEIVQQKLKVNGYEVTYLKKMQIKCPYCRTIHDKLLPQREGYATLTGVNQPKKYCMGLKQCQHILLRGKNKGLKCSKDTFGSYCANHSKLKSK